VRKGSETLTLYLYYFQLLGLAWASPGYVGLGHINRENSPIFLGGPLIRLASVNRF
jgi:hypothetical protein